MADRLIVYTATGTEGTDFFVSISPVMPNANYFVTAECGGVNSVIGIDLPDTSIGIDRTTSQFHVVATAPLAGASMGVTADRIEFHVYDTSTYAAVSPADFCVVSGSATLSDGIWTPAASSILEVAIPLQVGATLTSVGAFYTRGSTVPGTGAFTLEVSKRVLNPMSGLDTNVKTVLSSTSVSSGIRWQILASAMGSGLPYVAQQFAYTYVRLTCTTVGVQYGCLFLF